VPEAREAVTGRESGTDCGAKEQGEDSYFLYGIRREDLGRILFPLADLRKDEVRALARRAGLAVADKPGSQDICFAARRGVKAFLRERLGEAKPGPIVDAQGRVLGEHRGVAFHTIGERRGLALSSKAPLFVIALDAERATIVVGGRRELMSRGLVAGSLNLFVDDLPRRCLSKIRYRRKEVPCEASVEGDKARVVFAEPQEAVAPGQSVVFYEGDAVLGGGVIESIIC